MSTSASFTEVTHPGLVREQNEDSLGSIPELGLWVVADGMGGAASGEVASQIVTETVCAEVRNGSALPAAIVQANNEILEAVRSGRGGAGMASTVVALRLRGNDYEIAWVGDSRAYLWTGKKLVQLTRDHSMIQQLIDNGTFTPEQARLYPHLNMLQKAVGERPMSSADVDVVKGTLVPGQDILLCSDGLYGEVLEAEMASILADAQNEDDAVSRLLDSALVAGGADNITIQLVGAC